MFETNQKNWDVDESEHSFSSHFAIFGMLHFEKKSSNILNLLNFSCYYGCPNFGYPPQKLLTQIAQKWQLALFKACVLVVCLLELV